MFISPVRGVSICYTYIGGVACGIGCSRGGLTSVCGAAYVSARVVLGFMTITGSIATSSSGGPACRSRAIKGTTKEDFPNGEEKLLMRNTVSPLGFLYIRDEEGQELCQHITYLSIKSEEQQYCCLKVKYNII